MNAVVLARLKTFLGHELHYQPDECNAIISKVRALALMAGHDIDFRFANAGLGAVHGFAAAISPAVDRREFWRQAAWSRPPSRAA